MKFLSGLATFAVVTGVLYYGLDFAFEKQLTVIQAAYITLLAYLAGMIVVPPEVNVAVLTREDYEIMNGEDEDLSE